MPPLKSLELGEIELQDGIWEAVIELLQRSVYLSTKVTGSSLIKKRRTL